MFVGHALFAFALAVLFAERRGWSARHALALGIVTGSFAALPDVDVVYALFALDGGRFVSGGAVDPEAFWAAANSVHRSMTHSVIVALVAGPAFGLLTVGRARREGARTGRALAYRTLAAGALTALVGVAIAVSGPIGGIVMGAFVVAGVGFAAVIRRRTGLSPRVVAYAATAGLLTHPWGDLVTGQPPQVLYPFAVGLFDGRVVLHPDPTIHLLAAFAIELATVWLAVFAVVRVTDGSFGAFYDRSAALGAAYSVVPLVLVPPTLEVSYHFVFSILAVGAVCTAVSWARSGPLSTRRRGLFESSLPLGRPRFGVSEVPRVDGENVRSGFPFLAIGLVGVTIALVSYAIVYTAL